MNANKMSVEYCFVKQNSCFQVQKIWKALLGTLGKKISEKSPQSMFKTRLDTFGNDFWHFWDFETFLVFSKIIEGSTIHGTLGETFFFGKNAPKHVQSKFGQFCEGFWAFLDFWNFSKTRTSMEHWGKFFFRKKCPKTRLDTWERFWTILELWNLLDFFLEFFLSIYLDIWVRKTELKFLSSGIWTHNFESRKSEMEMRTLTVALMQKKWLLGIVSENWTHVYKSGKLNSFFWISRFWTHKFKSRRSEMPCREHWAKNFSEILLQRKFKRRLDNFGNDFGHFRNFETFLIFFGYFRKPGPPWNTGQTFFFEKIVTKHVQNKFGQFWKRFWAFLQFWVFFNFWKFSKTPQNTGQKNFFKKIAPKHVQNTFEYFCELFWAFLDFWKFSKTRTSLEHWGKIFFEKNAPKHVLTLENDFGQF